MQLSFFEPAMQPPAVAAPTASGHSPAPDSIDGLPAILLRPLADYEYFSVETRSGRWFIAKRWTREGRWLTLSGLRGNGPIGLTIQQRPVGGKMVVLADEIAIVSIVVVDDRG